MVNGEMQNGRGNVLCNTRDLSLQRQRPRGRMMQQTRTGTNRTERPPRGRNGRNVVKTVYQNAERGNNK
jgi:hypothetical protein